MAQVSGSCGVKAIILAGGFGTRLRSVVADQPKPLAQVQGRAFLSYLLDYCKVYQIQEVILSVGYLAEKIRDHFGEGYEGLRLLYADEDQPLGTGGAILNSLSLLAPDDQTVLIMNGDTFFPIPLPALYQFHRRMRAEVSISLLSLGQSQRYGEVELDEDQRVKRFWARSLSGHESSPRMMNGGVYLFETDWLKSMDIRPHQKISLEADLIPAWIEVRRRVFGLSTSGIPFLDIGVPEDYLKAQSFPLRLNGTEVIL